mmetsp:Transcript_9744/g.20789  ORF Transcript_9744/g.20789 Transcript_9744/m.20789 type:complete len:93 (+) Transcript_9744:696-974(+)
MHCGVHAPVNQLSVMGAGSRLGDQGKGSHMPACRSLLATYPTFTLLREQQSFCTSATISYYQLYVRSYMLFRPYHTPAWRIKTAGVELASSN